MGAWLKQLSQRTERTPFGELAARYSFVVPFAAIFVSFVLITTSNLVFHTPGGIAAGSQDIGTERSGVGGQNCPARGFDIPPRKFACEF